MTEFTADVSVEDVAVRDTNVSSAIDEPLRAMILDMLAEREMTIAAVHEELDARGFDRTENTVRHHVNELRDAGLVDVARLEERRGGTTKHYRANTIVLSYALPEGSEALVDEMAEFARPQVAELLDSLHDAYGDELDDVVGAMDPCQHCRSQKYETYVLLTVLRRAFVKASKAAGREG
jgi:DNA-binding transcriptional ArsR family regulator